MMLNFRGINGAGKTTLVNQLMKHLGPAEPIMGPDIRPRKGKNAGKPRPERIAAYRLRGSEQPMYVMGRYTNACGGLDNLSGVNWDWIVEEALRLESLGHVILEGAIASTIWGRFETMVQRSGSPFVWAFLDTPLEQCFANIQTRNGGKPIKEWRVLAKEKQHYRIIERVQENGYIERHIRWGHGLEDALAILEEFGALGAGDARSPKRPNFVQPAKVEELGSATFH